MFRKTQTKTSNSHQLIQKPQLPSHKLKTIRRNINHMDKLLLKYSKLVSSNNSPNNFVILFIKSRVQESRMFKSKPNKPQSCLNVDDWLLKRLDDSQLVKPFSQENYLKTEKQQKTFRRLSFLGRLKSPLRSSHNDKGKANVESTSTKVTQSSSTKSINRLSSKIEKGHFADQLYFFTLSNQCFSCCRSPSRRVRCK